MRRATYFLLVSRAIVESDDIAVLSWDMPPMPVSVAAGAMAAVSAAGASLFFGPQAAIATTAATIMIFFIVAPNMLRVWDSARLEPHCRRRYGAEPKHGRAFVKPGPRRPRPGLRANR